MRMHVPFKRRDTYCGSTSLLRESEVQLRLHALVMYLLKRCTTRRCSPAHYRLFGDVLRSNVSDFEEKNVGIDKHCTHR